MCHTSIHNIFLLHVSTRFRRLRVCHVCVFWWWDEQANKCFSCSSVAGLSFSNNFPCLFFRILLKKKQIPLNANFWILQGGPMEDTQNISLPQCLWDIVGMTFTLPVKVSQFNFSSKHKSFTIARIFELDQRLRLPNFEQHVNWLFYYILHLLLRSHQLSPFQGGDDNPGDDMGRSWSSFHIQIKLS